VPAVMANGKSEMPESRSGAPARGSRDAVSGTAPRLYQRATALLAGQIRDGVLPTGAYVTESIVAERFGISRAPARRALAELERRGLVEKAKGRGYAVLDGAPAAAGRVPVQPEEESVRLLSLPSWERIYGEVENEIIARISFASWQINEARLARHYGVSRTVARDVVGRLQQRGILRKDERSRWYAPALTPEHIGELYELRAILEPVALAKAAPRLPAGLLQRMRQDLEAAIGRGDVAGATLDRLEEAMHVTLLGYCGNHALMQAITLPQSLLIAHRFLYRWTPRLFAAEPFLPEHLDIVEHLERGATAGAAAALEQHLRASRDRAITRVDVIQRAFAAEELPYLERLGPS
jgi:DNA-binding GntR family transcriptional regulator